MPASTPQPTTLTNKTFAEFLRTHRFVVIHFWAEWNEYDEMMQRLLGSELSDEVRELVAFARVDINLPEHHDLCRQHNLLNVPFLAFYRDSSLIRTVTGIRTAEVIADYVRELVTPPAS